MGQGSSWELNVVPELPKIFPTFYETQRFFTIATVAHHQSLPWPTYDSVATNSKII